MTEQIYIPKKLKVGYQKRGDTYSGKLGFVTYLDDKNVHRQEKSFNGWIDEKIGVDDFENKPTEGFVLNRNVGGVYDSYANDIRIEKVRVYDPRGFEFEIDIPNVLRILQECTSTKGKGLEGQFIYGWSGKKLLLIPVDSNEYRKAVETTKLQAMNISIKDLVVGHAYLTKKNEEIVYLGRFDWHSCELNYVKGRYVGGFKSKKEHIFAVKADEEYIRLYGDFTLADFDEQEDYFEQLKEFNDEVADIAKNNPYNFKVLSSTKALAKDIGEINSYPEILEHFNKSKHSSKFVSIETKPFESKLIASLKHSWFEIEQPNNLCILPSKENRVELININNNKFLYSPEELNEMDLTSLEVEVHSTESFEYDKNEFIRESIWRNEMFKTTLDKINTMNFVLAYAKLENGTLVPINEFCES